MLTVRPGDYYELKHVFFRYVCIKSRYDKHTLVE